MINRRLRPQTDDERVTAENYIAYLHREIAGRRSPARLVNGTVIGILLGLMLGSIVAGVLQRSGLPELVWKLSLLFVGTVGAVLGLRIAERNLRAERFRFQMLLPVWNRILEEGLMEEWEVTVSDCVRLENDSEPAYFLDIGDGKVLFLIGWYLADAVEEQRFPCTAFTLLRFPGGEREFSGIDCVGELLGPLRTIEYEALPPDYLPEDGEVLTASLETLEDDLQYLSET